MFDGRTLDLFASKSEAVRRCSLGLRIPGIPGARVADAKGRILEGDPYIYHFPDGKRLAPRGSWCAE